MASIASEVRAARGKPGVACGLSAFLRGKPPEEARCLMRAVLDRSSQSTAVWRVLRRRGYGRGPLTVTRHRLYACAYCAALRKELKSR